MFGDRWHGTNAAVHCLPSAQHNQSQGAFAWGMITVGMILREDSPWATRHSQWDWDLAIWVDVAQRNLGILPKPRLQDTARAVEAVILDGVKCSARGRWTKHLIQDFHEGIPVNLPSLTSVHLLKQPSDFWQSVLQRIAVPRDVASSTEGIRFPYSSYGLFQ